MKVFVTGALGFIGRALVERHRAGGMCRTERWLTDQGSLR